MPIVLAESTARSVRAGRNDATAAVATAASRLVDASSLQHSLDSDPVALRTFFNDCITVGIGAQRALDRFGADATSLERLARWSMEYEQRTQTGCLMVQALTLVRYWTLQAHQPITPDNEKRIVQWRQSICAAAAAAVSVS